MDATDIARSKGGPHGVRRWLFSTNHKDIGTMYLMFAIFAGVVGGALSIAMRLELQEPGQQYFDLHTYNRADVQSRLDHDLLHDHARPHWRLRRLVRAVDDLVRRIWLSRD